MKQTAGSIALDLLKSRSRETGFINIQEVEAASREDRVKNILYTVQHARKKIDCRTERPSYVDAHHGHDDCHLQEAMTGDFFIEISLKKEKLMENVFRSYYVALNDCPTPKYDQTVFKFDHKKEQLQFLWVVPDDQTALTFKENALSIVPEEQELLKFVLAYYDGSLLQLAKYLNGEKKGAGILLEQ